MPGPAAEPTVPGTGAPRGCVRVREQRRPAQGSGSTQSTPGERHDPGRLSLCRSPFCPTVALLLPDRGRAGFGRWTCILSARPGGWGGGGAVPNRSATGAGGVRAPAGWGGADDVHGGFRAFSAGNAAHPGRFPPFTPGRRIAPGRRRTSRRRTSRRRTPLPVLSGAGAGDGALVDGALSEIVCHDVPIRGSKQLAHAQ